MLSLYTLSTGHTLAIFDAEQDLTSVYQLQDDDRALVYVALEGTDDKYLHPENFLVENYETDMDSHFLYNGLVLDDERTEYLIEKAEKFIKTGKQLFIEEYEFTSAEPFYDYTKE